MDLYFIGYRYLFKGFKKRTIMFVYVKIQEDELRLIQSFQGDRTMVLSRDYWEAGFKHSNGKGYTLVHISEEEFLPLFYNMELIFYPVQQYLPNCMSICQLHTLILCQFFQQYLLFDCKLIFFI